MKSASSSASPCSPAVNPGVLLLSESLADGVFRVVDVAAFASWAEDFARRRTRRCFGAEAGAESGAGLRRVAERQSRKRAKLGLSSSPAVCSLPLSDIWADRDVDKWG